jgi:hypothetical protein
MTTTLPLDETSIDPNELSRSTLMREIGLQKRPPWLLRKFMSSLESKRQKKGLGWSRPWNKYHLNVFRTHIHSLSGDRDYLNSILEAIQQATLPQMDVSSEYQSLIPSLLKDPKLMAFTFYHNREENGQQYEGFTLSLGRIVDTDKTKRDRVDLILEDKRVDGTVDGILDSVRIYINPWSMHSQGKYHSIETLEPADIHMESQNIFDDGVQKYQQWKEDPKRQWEHWSIQFIEYFGPRTFIPKGTAFT